jgi:lipoprotein-anchoring transpeptidase ErfK/SrfK
MCAVIIVAAKKSQRRPDPPVVVTPPAVSRDIAVTPPPVSPDVAEKPPEPKESIPAKPRRSDLAKNTSGTVIVVDKEEHTLEVFSNGEAIKEYGIAVGKNLGDKKKRGDMRTPEGEFPIVRIEDASAWTHDFRDGKGQIKGAYGPYFIRLGTPPWTGIGIHGTHAPNSIGTNVTEGCIRLNNEDLKELRRIVKKGDKVIIRK